MPEVLTDSEGWAECPHGLPKMTCSACRHPHRGEQPPTVERYFDARYDGQCGECNLPIMVGQRVAKMSNETYQHAHCAAAVSDETGAPND